MFPLKNCWAAIGLLVLFVGFIETSATKEKAEDVKSSELPKNGRFVSFNNNDGEVKIELDFAVPFMKIPMSTPKNGELVKPSLSVNANGLVTIGTMLVLFVTLVPKIVQLFIPHAQGTVTDSLLPMMMGRVDDALRAMDISTIDCYQRSACWVASNAFAQFPSTTAKSSQWVGSFIENEAMQAAFYEGLNGGDCLAYKCPLSMSSISKIFKMGHSALENKGSENSLTGQL